MMMELEKGKPEPPKPEDVLQQILVELQQHSSILQEQTELLANLSQALTPFGGKS